MTVTVPQGRDGEGSKMVLSSSSSQCNEGDGPVKEKSTQWGRAKNGVVACTWEERTGGQQRLHQEENAPGELEDEFSKQIKSWALGTFQGKEIWPSGSMHGRALKDLSGRGVCICVCMHVYMWSLYCILKACWGRYGGQTEGPWDGSRDWSRDYCNWTSKSWAGLNQGGNNEAWEEGTDRRESSRTSDRKYWAMCGCEKEVHSKPCCSLTWGTQEMLWSGGGS